MSTYVRLGEENAALVGREVTHGAVRTLPHLLQFEFLHPSLVWRDGSAFDPDVVLLDGLRRVDRDLVVGLATSGNQRQDPDAGAFAQVKRRGRTASRDSSPRS